MCYARLTDYAPIRLCCGIAGKSELRKTDLLNLRILQSGLYLKACSQNWDRICAKEFTFRPGIVWATIYCANITFDCAYL